jgi:hypothetical protein
MVPNIHSDAEYLNESMAETGHPHPGTPLQTSSTTSHTILNGTSKQQRSKAIDMRFYRVHDRAVQNQFDIGWGLSAQNLGEYFTKHHTPVHHKGIHKKNIHDDTSPTYILSADTKPPQGCVDITISPHSPAGHNANTAMARARSTSINWQCLARTLFLAPTHSLIISHKSI